MGVYTGDHYLFICGYLKFCIVEYKAPKYQIYLKRRFLLHCLQFSRKFIYRTLNFVHDCKATAHVTGDKLYLKKKLTFV